MIDMWQHRLSLRQLSRLLMAVVLSMVLVMTGLASVVAKGPEFERVFRESGVMMLLIDPDTGNIVEANDAAAEFYGYPIEQLQQMTIPADQYVHCRTGGRRTKLWRRPRVAIIFFSVTALPVAKFEP